MWRALNHDRDGLLDLFKGVLLLLLIVVAGTGLLGESRDFLNYRGLFEDAAVSPLTDVLLSNDPLYNLLSKSFSYLGLPFSLFYLSLVLLILCLKFHVFGAIEEIRGNPVLFFTIYLSLLYWLQDYTQVRLSLAVAIFLLAAYLKVPYRTLFFLTALSVHGATALLIAMYYVAKSRWLAYLGTIFLLYFAYFLISAGGLLQAIVSMGESLHLPVVYKAADYAYSFQQGEFTELNLLSPTPALQLLFVALTYRKSLASEQNARLELIMSLVGPLCFYAFSELPVIATRMYELFIIFFVIYVCKIWSCLTWEKLLIPLYLGLGIRTSFFGGSPIISVFAD